MGAEGAIEVFTTRVDTIYGVTFMVLAPEHEFVADLTTKEQKAEIEAYQKWAATRSEIERMAEVKKVTGEFTGAYCINPLNGEKVPIYIADYVLADYGTGAIMGVPSGDQRDWNFAKHFNLPIVPILDAQKDLETVADNTKEGRYINSGIINGMEYKEATTTLIAWLEERGLGKGKIQYRIRNAVFSRQRYWGEPVPAYWKDGVPYLIDESELPLVLPKIDKYLPTETGEPPLGRAEGWKYQEAYEYELSTMPGWAGSSWYFYRYMDANNPSVFASKEAVDYWKQVDLYMGGTEHAVGHLLYSRFWNLFMYDLGLVPEKEYAKKLVNQGMIQGVIEYMYMRRGYGNTHIYFDKETQKPYTVDIERILPGIHALASIYYSKDVADDYTVEIPIWVEAIKSYGTNEPSYIDSESIEILAKGMRSDFRDSAYITSDGILFKGKYYAFDGSLLNANDFKLYTKSEVGKMSKSKYNVVNPDDIVAKYGADCFRMYEMFLGPLEDSKPWSTTGITGVQGFLRKLWSLFYDLNTDKNLLTDDAPTPEELKVLHACIKKVSEDIERFSFNTCVASFMIAVNEFKSTKCSKRLVLNELVVLVAPFAPFIAEELWAILGHTTSVLEAQYPTHNEEYLIENEILYPISINGKKRGEYTFAADASPADIEKVVRAMEVITKWSEGKEIKKVIVVQKGHSRMVNVVL